MSKTYDWMVEGTDANGKQWGVRGRIDALPGDIFGKVWQVIGAEVITQLTKGDTGMTFGKPGYVCKGPYNIIQMNIEQIKE